MVDGGGAAPVHAVAAVTLSRVFVAAAAAAASRCDAGGDLQLRYLEACTKLEAFGIVAPVRFQHFLPLVDATLKLVAAFRTRVRRCHVAAALPDLLRSGA